MYTIIILLFHCKFTFKITIKDSDVNLLEDANVKVEEQSSDREVSTNTGSDGTTTNKAQKFQYGSKLTITVKKAAFFAKTVEYEFKDTETEEQKFTIILVKAGMIYCFNFTSIYCTTYNYMILYSMYLCM